MRDSDLPLNCCGLGVSSHALRPHTTRMPAMQPQSVNTSVGSGDGDAVTDSFKDGVIHARRVAVLGFRKADGMVIFNEKADAKSVMKSLYTTNLWTCCGATRSWSSCTSHGLPTAF